MGASGREGRGRTRVVSRFADAEKSGLRLPVPKRRAGGKTSSRSSPSHRSTASSRSLDSRDDRSPVFEEEDEEARLLRLAALAEARERPRPDEELLEGVRLKLVADTGEAVRFVYQLITDGEDVNQRTVHGFTPLAIAAAAGNVHLASLLLEHGASVTQPCLGRAEQPLHHVVNFGHIVCCHLIADAAAALGAIDAPDSAGWTPLQLANRAERDDLMLVLLKARADPNARNRCHGDEMAIHACARRGDKETLELLLDYEADLNALDRQGREPLHVAAANEHYDTVSLLLRYRARPEHRDAGGRTALECVPRREEPIDDADDGGGGVIDPLERLRQLLRAYMRAPPEQRRVDTRYDTRREDVDVI